MVFFAETFLPVLASRLLFNTSEMSARTKQVYRFFLLVSVSLWVYFLQYLSVHAAGDREKFLNEIKPINLGAVLPVPTIKLLPALMTLETFPKEVRRTMEELYKTREEEGPERAYVKAASLLGRTSDSLEREWLTFQKADFLFEVEWRRADGRLAGAVEEYDAALVRFPLNDQKSRVLYQIALSQLRMGFWQDVENTAERALKEGKSGDFEPLYHLLLGEQAFQSRSDVRASEHFTYIIERFPKSGAAVDAAFRKAFILFRKGDFVSAIKAYENLNRFHAEEFERLRMKREPTDLDKYIDRIYYAETVYLNRRYQEASRLFQDLGNLFPTHTLTPFVYIRYGDTYRERGQYRAAESIYDFVQTRWPKVELAQSLSKIHLADLLFLWGDIRATRRNQKLYKEAFDIARRQSQTANEAIAAEALAKLAAHFLYDRIYPKAQNVLRQYKHYFETSLNQDWVQRNLTKTIEIEIQDYYGREDYLAALTTFLVYQREHTHRFGDTRVLFRLADAAKRLSLYEKSAEILNQIIYMERSSEGRQEALLKLVDLLILQGDTKRAGERLRRFNFAYPKTHLKHLYEMYWGKLYESLNNPERSVQHYEAALAAANNDAKKTLATRSVLISLGQLYQQLALPVRAIDAYERFIRLVRDYKGSNEFTQRDTFLTKVARYRIADLFFGMRDYVKAIDAYRNVAKEVQEEPFLSHAQYRMGECYLALNDRPSALEAFKKLKSDDVSNIWARAAKSYIQSVEMEVKYGIRIFN